MNNTICIPVIWVEDKPESIGRAVDYFAEPLLSNLTNVSYCITPEVFTDWKKAEERLNQPNDFIAIILDAMCKIDSNTAPSIEKFIPHVNRRIGKVGVSELPVFYYSGQGDKPLLADMEFDKEDPDYKWKKENHQAYYRKGIDIKALKDNIITYAQSQSIFKLKYAIYRDLFLAVRELKLNDEVEHNLISLLAPLHFDTPNVQEYISKASCVRTSVEHFVQCMRTECYLKDM